MILLFAGVAFIVLGLFSGAVLVAAPFGLLALEPGFALWFFFPVFSLLGLVLVIMGARTSQIRVVSLAVSCFLLVLAVGSALGLVLSAASVARAPSGTGPLWFVLVVAGLLGTIGIASYSRGDASTPAGA